MEAAESTRGLGRARISAFFTPWWQRNEDCLIALAEEERGKGLKLMKRLILALGIGWALIYATFRFGYAAVDDRW